MMPELLKDRLCVVEHRTGRQTRQAGCIAVDFRRTKSAQKSLFFEGVKMYNSLPEEIRRCKCLVAFRRMLKDYILSSLLI